MNLDGKRIVLVGGAGLIGSHVLEHLLREPVREVVVFDNFCRGTVENVGGVPSTRYGSVDGIAHVDPRVTLIDGDMRDQYAVRQTIKGADSVFLLASLWLGECVTCPGDAWEVNVLGTLNVVAACADYGVKRVIYSSSASVYGDAVATPITEDHPFNNRTTYGATKIACEQMLRATHAQYGLDYLALRYMNVYGPRMDYRGAYVSVIMRALDKILAGESPVIHGDGSQTYDFVYVDDVARANVLAMKSEATNRAINVGTGIGTTVNEIVELLIEITGSHARPVYEKEALSLVQRRVGSTKLARDLINFVALVTPRDGLGRTVAWRKSQAHRCEANS